MLYAMIDVGSNTIRMAIYEIESDRVEMLMKRKYTVGLAAYVRDGYMQQQGIDKVVEIIQDYRNFLDDLGITRVTAFTTAALRNAINGLDAVREISYRTRTNLTLMSGDDEATYDFIGATHNLDEDKGLLIDIGGGSTEIVYFNHREIQVKVS